jgi:hypothetical protein
MTMPVTRVFPSVGLIKGPQMESMCPPWVVSTPTSMSSAEEGLFRLNFRFRS